MGAKKQAAKNPGIGSVLKSTTSRKWTNEVVIYGWPLVSKILTELNQGPDDSFGRKIVKLVYFLIVKRNKPWL